MIDLDDNDRWIELGESSAWCWQQGCMLQWLPGSNREIIYNDRDGNGGLCSHILNVHTGERRTLPFPIYTLSPDGGTALCLDFFRTGWLRKGYGYAGTDPFANIPAPAEQGIYRCDLESGEINRIISLEQLASIHCSSTGSGALHHWVNHLLVSPDGERFIFLHRWKPKDNPGSFITRACTANLDGSDLRIIHDGGNFSHFIWDGPQDILAWARRDEADFAFYRINQHTGEATAFGTDVMTRDGHISVLPGSEWIVNDHYPTGQTFDKRCQPLYLYNTKADRRIDLEILHTPARYSGEWRCDLHPRISPDGTKITFDGVQSGQGRQIYLLDIGELLDSFEDA
jgi:hypothetical protein